MDNHQHLCHSSRFGTVRFEPEATAIIESIAQSLQQDCGDNISASLMPYRYEGVEYLGLEFVGPNGSTTMTFTIGLESDLRASESDIWVKDATDALQITLAIAKEVGATIRP